MSHWCNDVAPPKCGYTRCLPHTGRMRQCMCDIPVAYPQCNVESSNGVVHWAARNKPEKRAKMSPSRHRSLTQRGVLGRLSQSQAYACRGTKGTLASVIRPLRGSSTAGHLRRHNVHMTDPQGISAWYRKAASPLRDLFSGRGFCTRASALRRSTAGSAVVCSMPRLTLCQETGARRGGNSQGKDPEHAMGMSA